MFQFSNSGHVRSRSIQITLWFSVHGEIMIHYYSHQELYNWLGNLTRISLCLEKACHLLFLHPISSAKGFCLCFNNSCTNYWYVTPSGCAYSKISPDWDPNIEKKENDAQEAYGVWPCGFCALGTDRAKIKWMGKSQLYQRFVLVSCVHLLVPKNMKLIRACCCAQSEQSPRAMWYAILPKWNIAIVFKKKSQNAISRMQWRAILTGHFSIIHQVIIINKSVIYCWAPARAVQPHCSCSCTPCTRWQTKISR